MYGSTLIISLPYLPYSLHFLSRSPSPTSSFEFQTFPYIEHPEQTSGLPGTNGPYHGTVAFGGFTSDSDYQDEAASSFSSLPTSQFALKPSSSDVECDAETLEPRSWVGSKAAATMAYVMGERAVNSMRRGANDYLSQPVFPEKSPSLFVPLSAQPPPSLSHNATPTSTPAQKQQVVEPKDMSRASLSVTDSKTIILSNAGAARPPPPPTSTAGGGSSVSGSVTPTADKASTQQTATATTKAPPAMPVVPPPVTSAPAARTTSLATASTVSASDKKNKLTLNGPRTQSQALSTPVPTPTPSSDSCKDQVLDAWSMNRPAANILHLDLPVQKNSKRSGTHSATVDTALFITTQLLQTQIKKEVGDSAITPHHFPLGRLTSAISSRDFLQQQPQLTTGANSAKVETLPLTPISSSSSSSVRTSLPTSSAAATTARRGSTNGSNYPEIFRSVSRQLSETDTGLKQALAGYVRM